MKARYITLLLLLAAGCAGVVRAQSPNWLIELMVVRAPQTKVVRHPRDIGKYYLCWQDGSDRYGIYFKKRNFTDALRRIRPGQSISLASTMTVNESGWTAQDERICWGNRT